MTGGARFVSLATGVRPRMRRYAGTVASVATVLVVSVCTHVTATGGRRHGGARAPGLDHVCRQHGDKGASLKSRAPEATGSPRARCSLASPSARAFYAQVIDNVCRQCKRAGPRNEVLHLRAERGSPVSDWSMRATSASSSRPRPPGEAEGGAAGGAAAAHLNGGGKGGRGVGKRHHQKSVGMVQPPWKKQRAYMFEMKNGGLGQGMRR